MQMFIPGEVWFGLIVLILFIIIVVYGKVKLF